MVRIVGVLTLLCGDEGLEPCEMGRVVGPEELTAARHLQPKWQMEIPINRGANGYESRLEVIEVLRV